MRAKSKERIFARKFSYESKNPWMDFWFECSITSQLAEAKKQASGENQKSNIAVSKLIESGPACGAKTHEVSF